MNNFPITPPPGVARACGERVEDGFYLCCGLGVGGRPLEEFLFCQPLKIPDGLVISARGVSMHQDPETKVWHVFDHIGVNNYPNVADMVEELRRFGMSRRVQKNLDFGLLTPGRSKVYMVHARAYIENFADYYVAQPGGWKDCPKMKHDPDEDEVFCSRLWWEDIEGGDATYDEDEPGSGPGDRRVTRHLPSLVYTGLMRPEDVTPVYEKRVFAGIPITALTIIRGKNTKQNLRRVEKDRRIDLPVVLENS